MKKIVRLLCKNNNYVEFGNHTGFIRRDCKHEYLEIGKYYDFIIKDNNWYYMTDFSGNTRAFLPQPKSIPDRNNLYYFFYTSQESRDLKLKHI